MTDGRCDKDLLLSGWLISGHVTSLRRLVPEAWRHVSAAAAPQPDAVGVRGQTGPADERLASSLHPFSCSSPGLTCGSCRGDGSGSAGP